MATLWRNAKNATDVPGLYINGKPTSTLQGLQCNATFVYLALKAIEDSGVGDCGCDCNSDIDLAASTTVDSAGITSEKGAMTDEELIRMDVSTNPQERAVPREVDLDAIPDDEWDAPVMTDVIAASLFGDFPARADTIPDVVGLDSLESAVALQPHSHHLHRPSIMSSEAAFGSTSSSDKANVSLRLYNMSKWYKLMGLPIFHVGVEVYGTEYFFTSSGIDACKPGQYAAQVYIDAIPLGGTDHSLDEVNFLLARMAGEWRGSDYQLLGYNCQDFAIAFCEQMGVQEKIPSWAIRFAGMRRVLPPSVIDTVQDLEHRFHDVQRFTSQEIEAERRIKRPAARIGVGLTSGGSGRLVAVVPKAPKRTPPIPEVECPVHADGDFHFAL